MGERSREASLLQRTWRGRLPAERPAGVEAIGWILLVQHVAGGKSFRALAAELGLRRDQVRTHCYRAADQLRRRLTGS